MAERVSVDNMLHQKPTQIVGTHGFLEFDRDYGCIKEQEFIVVGGRPAMGITTFLCQMAVTNLKLGKKVLYMQYGHSNQYIWNCIANYYLQNTTFSSDGFTPEQTESLSVLKSQLFFIEGYSSFALMSKEEVLELWQIKDLDMVIVDGLLYQKGETKHVRENQQIRMTMQMLREITLETRVPIVLSSGLNRNVSYRAGDHRPELFDLQGSSALEELTDRVIMLHRPSYYGILEDHLGNSLVDLTEIMVLKDRAGQLGSSNLYFNRKSRSLSAKADFKIMEELGNSAIPFNFTEEYGALVKKFKLEKDSNIENDAPF